MLIWSMSNYAKMNGVTLNFFFLVKKKNVKVWKKCYKIQEKKKKKKEKSTCCWHCSWVQKKISRLYNKEFFKKSKLQCFKYNLIHIGLRKDIRVIFAFLGCHGPICLLPWWHMFFIVMNFLEICRQLLPFILTLLSGPVNLHIPYCVLNFLITGIQRLHYNFVTNSAMMV